MTLKLNDTKAYEKKASYINSHLYKDYAGNLSTYDIRLKPYTRICTISVD